MSEFTCKNGHILNPVSLICAECAEEVYAEDGRVDDIPKVELDEPDDSKTSKLFDASSKVLSALLDSKAFDKVEMEIGLGAIEVYVISVVFKGTTYTFRLKERKT